MCKKYFIFSFIVLFIFVLDQYTKNTVYTQLELGETIVVFRDYINITYVKNYGAAFGILSNAPEYVRKLFLLSIPLGVITFITFNVRRISDQERMKLIAVSAIAGGALGNWTSRLEHGFVIDFLDFHFKRYFTYPAFNISDCAIVIGALLMGVLIIRDEGQKKIAGVHP